tara:strand:- start:175 stop:354 length:180 start_codon:yes stop_codon:yes gene_type:complete
LGIFRTHLGIFRTENSQKNAEKMPNPTINNYIFYAKKIKKCKKEMVQQKKKGHFKNVQF